MKNIMVTTLGIPWALVAELVGFTNPDELPLYKNSSHYQCIKDLRETYSITQIDE